MSIMKSMRIYILLAVLLTVLKKNQALLLPLILQPRPSHCSSSPYTTLQPSIITNSSYSILLQSFLTNCNDLDQPPLSP